MSNQMLAGIALTLATVIICKSKGRRFFYVTAIPLVFVVATTSYATWQKVFSDDLKIGFLAKANFWQEKISSGAIASLNEVQAAEKIIFNQHLVAYIALFFGAILWIILLSAVTKIPQISNFLHLLKIHLNGDFAYQKYLEHHLQTQPDSKPLNKKSFLQNRQKRKSKSINRCC